jgi:hypothetical protein
MLLLMVPGLLLAACADNPPVPRPETARLMPSEFKGVYLGMAKEDVDNKFAADGTRLTKEGLETVTRFVRDSIQVGLAFAYRDGRVSVATAWYDYALVPKRIGAERRNFLAFLLHRNGLNYQYCSFNIPGAPFVQNIGLGWKYPGYQVVATFAMPIKYVPDSIPYRPYLQFSIFDSLTTPRDLWPDIVIPAPASELKYFREVDSVSNVVSTMMETRP